MTASFLLLLASLLFLSSTAFSDQFLAQVSSDHDFDFEILAAKWNAEYVGPVKGLPSVHVFRTTSPKRAAELELLERNFEEGEILWIEREEPVNYRPIPPREPDTPEPSDPSARYQWHLYNTRVDEAWRLGYSGKGIRMSVLDSGCNKHSTDLTNLDLSNSWNYATDKQDPTPPQDMCVAGKDDCSHGTTCANLALGASNDFCGVGIAPSTTLQGFLVLPPYKSGVWVTNKDFAEATTHPTDVSSNSYGPWVCVPETPWVYECDLIPISKTEVSAIESMITEGRDGKGTIFLYASGNDGDVWEDTNLQGTLTNRHVMAIGAATSKYEPSGWSCPGAGLMLIAPGNSLYGTTVEMTKNGGQEMCGSIGSGTSWACPITAGAVSVLLEANPNLTWRDVQHIFARSSYRQPAKEYRTNSGGRKFGYNSGFGNLDIQSALKLASNWTTFPQERSTIGQNRSIVVAGNVTDYWITINDDLMVESVNLVLDISIQRRGGVAIEMISPSGTIHNILKPRPDTDPNYVSWQILARGFWDERSKGVWIVRITRDSSYKEAGRITINGMTLTAYGTTPSEYPKNPEIAPKVEAPFLTATSVKDTSVKIAFDEMGQKVEMNELQMKGVEDGSEWVSAGSTDSASLKVKKLKANTIYLFRGRSKVKSDWSEWGHVLSLITARS